MAPATPLKLFNKEIVIGISAPPTRIEKMKPKAVDIKTFSTSNIHKNLGFIAPTGIKIPVKAINAIVRDNKAIVRTWCPFKTTGFCGRIRCNLPAAIKLPDKVIIPTATAKAEVVKVKASTPNKTFPSTECFPANAREAIPTTAEAAPPKPLSKATS